MSEPTRHPTLTLRASSNTVARSRSKDTSTAALVTPHGLTRRENIDDTADHTLSSAHLLQGRNRIFIEHNGEQYQLRATRLGKLILTK
ncbi:hemin uptake protein HemP [Trinickia acidisoli]|uniref:hemin uptake protein HemP n=1 Tax=Trinickia acidisoli TaxID=2767482 RepID=UPI001A8EB24F|nr:hemin uptake protein HemP [Trinickia acidisoli]